MNNRGSLRKSEAWGLDWTGRSKTQDILLECGCSIEPGAGLPNCSCEGTGVPLMVGSCARCWLEGAHILLQCSSGCICERVWGGDLHLHHRTRSRADCSRMWVGLAQLAKGLGEQEPPAGRRTLCSRGPCCKLHLQNRLPGCTGDSFPSEREHQLCGLPPGARSAPLADCELASLHHHVSQLFTVSFFLYPEAYWFCLILDIWF